MINHSQNIIINSEKQKIWNFIIDFSRSLVFDKNYIKIELPYGYTTNKDSKFIIKGKYLFTKYYFEATILTNIAPNNIIIKCIDKHNSKIFQIKSFNILIINNEAILEYDYKATFNNVFKNIILYYPLKASCMAELVFIKKAIESSDYINERQEVKTILH